MRTKAFAECHSSVLGMNLATKCNHKESCFDEARSQMEAYAKQGVVGYDKHVAVWKQHKSKKDARKTFILHATLLNVVPLSHFLKRPKAMQNSVALVVCRFSCLDEVTAASI